MVHTTGVILDNLMVSQLNIDVLLKLNEIAKASNKNICAFFKNISPSCINLRFGVFGLNSIHNIEEGSLFSTDLDSAEVLIKSQTTAKKYFYVWDLEWLHNPTKRNFLNNIDIYRNITLLTRSNTYADALENYCNVRPKVISIEEALNVY